MQKGRIFNDVLFIVLGRDNINYLTHNHYPYTFSINITQHIVINFFAELGKLENHKTPREKNISNKPYMHIICNTFLASHAGTQTGTTEVRGLT